MPTSTEAVTFSIEVELAKLNAQLASIPNTTKKEAMAATSALKRTMDDLTRAAKAQTDAISTQVKGATKAVESGVGAAKAGAVNLMNQIFDVGSQLTTGTSPITILIQQGPQVAGALNLMGVSMSRMLAVAGPLGAALGLGALAYSRYAESVAAAELAQKQAKEATEEEIKLQKALADAVIKNAVLTGRMTEEEGIAYEAAEKAADLYAVRKAALIDRINEEQIALKAAQAARSLDTDAIEADIDASRRSGGARMAAIQASREAEAAVGEHTAKLTALGTELGDLTQREQRYGELLAENEKLQKNAGKADDARRQAAEELAAALAAIVSGYQQYDRQVSQLSDMQRAAETAQLDAIGQVRAAQEDALAQAAELYREADKNAQGSAARREAAEAQYAATVVAINEKAAFDIDKINADAAAKEAARQEKAAKDAQRLREQQVAAAAALTRTIGGYMGDVASVADAAYSRQVDIIGRLKAQLGAGEEYLTEKQKAELNNRIRAQEKAARRAFEVSKALRIAQATANAYAAASQAFAEVPYPFNFAAGATALVAGLANVAQIAATQPAFHRGGMIDEQRITALSGEAVLSRQGVQALGGEQAVNRINSTGGSASGAGTVYAVSVYRHDRITERWQADGLRRGDPVSRAIQSARATPYGHRS